MANFKNIAMAILMVIVAFAFASCEADVFEDGWDNGWNPTPEDPTYELVTEHVNSTSNGMVLLDDHKAILKKDGRVIDEKPYKATHEVSCSKITLKRAVAEQLENKTVAYANGFNLNGTLMTASVELTDCKTVYFSENDRTYCHPQYGVDGAIAKLTCCNPQPTSLELKEISGNILNGFVVVKDHGEEKFPVEIIVTDDDVLGWEVDDYAVVTGRNEVTIKAYETKNGVRTGRVETLTAGYSATLTAGAIITKTSQDILRLVNTTATLSSSTASFSYVLGSESFEDKWNWSASNTATFTLPDGQTQTTKPVKADYSVRSTDLSIDGNVYSNAASLYAGTVEVADGVQLIQINVPATPDFPGYKPYNTEQWAVTRIYDTNALQSLVIWVFTLQNVETGAIVGGYKVLDGNGNTAALPTQLQNLSTPSFTSPYSMYFNTKTSAWEYGSLNHANKGTRNEVWEYLKWDTSDNQPMSVNISQDVADDIVWLEDNMVMDGNVITITYNGKKYTVVTE